MSRRVFAGLALLLAGCGDLDHRQSTELIVVSDQLRLVDMRAGAGATGALRGSGQLLVDRWVPESSPITFAERGGPSEVRANEAGVIVGGDALHAVDDEIEAVVTSPELGLRMSARGLRDAPVAACATARWESAIQRVEVEGWVEAAQRGGSVRGPALWIQRLGAPPTAPRRLIYLRTGEVELLWSEDGCTTWRKSTPGSEEQEPPSDLEISLDPWGRGQVRAPSAGLDLRLRPTGVRGATAVYAHLSPPEAWLAGALSGRAERRVALVEAQGQLGVNTAPIRATALFLEVGPAVAQADQ
jgi:hypothetical protein